LAMFISVLAALYSLGPIRSSLRLLEDFIKDIIHDLNTPLTSILIGLKMLEHRCDKIDRISSAAKNISMLHQNLDAYLKDIKGKTQRFDVKEVVEEQVNFFMPLYDYLEWRVDVPSSLVSTDKNAFTRMIYNLLSNACKYNTTNGSVTLLFEHDILMIHNDSYGVKHPEQVFERFYKEGERGLGIGLHIVAKLSKELGIKKSFCVENNKVSVSLDLSQVTSK